MDEQDQNKKTRTGNLRRELSNMGGARSLIGQARQGGNVIGSGVRVIGEATKRTLEPARFETFESAMERLGVSAEELPVIHNQLVLQVYLTFFVGCVALASMANLAFQGTYFAALVALLIASAAFAKTIQSSIQCLFIRQKRLGISMQWWSKPGDWFPNRIEGLVKMEANDPLRDSRTVNSMARLARRHFKFGLVVLLPGLVSFAVFGSWGWPLVSTTAALVFWLLGASLSFEVFKRREGVFCDLYPWLSSPEAWVPSAQAVTEPGATRSEKPMATPMSAMSAMSVGVAGAAAANESNKTKVV